MAKLKRSKRAFRRGGSPRLGMLLVTIPVFLLLCLILSVAIGLVLGRRAEAVDAPRVFDLAAEAYPSGSKTVPVVDAYLFPTGADPRRYTGSGITDLSLCLRDGEGNLAYPVEPALDGSGEVSETEPLAEAVAAIHSAGGRACAYFYVTSFGLDDPYLRELQAAYEVALVNRAARAGVDEILLVGLPVTEETVAAAEAYVSKMSAAAEQALLGVLAAPELFALSEEDVYLAARIRSVCDFMALDLRGLPENADEIPVGEADTGIADGTGASEPEGLSVLERTLEENEYYIKAYRLRLVLSSENAALYDALKAAGAENLQIIGN